jgi:SAM-dependent MidA family methyltransferase
MQAKRLRSSQDAMPSDDDVSPNNLANRLRERIKREGPMTFRDWMHAALYDDRDGYYCRRDLIRQGRAGDYRTAPETSALFGATFAHYFAKLYSDLGAPPHWTIVEAGAGSGEFARGVLHTLKSSFPRIFAATTYLIDEISPDGRAQARANLEQFLDRVEFTRLADLSEPLPHGIIFSNELIDAFPVHRVTVHSDARKELCVDVTEAGEFVWVESDLSEEVAEYCERAGLRLFDGQIYEVNLGAEQFVAHAGDLLKNGLLITVDYGASRDELLTTPHRFKGTLRAFRRHQISDQILANPGSQDLTTNVDWTQLMEAGARSGFETLRFERLDQFLLHEGLPEILLTITNRITDAAAIASLQVSARDMIRPDRLAASFQVLIQRKGSSIADCQFPIAD